MRDVGFFLAGVAVIATLIVILMLGSHFIWTHQ